MRESFRTTRTAPTGSAVGGPAVSVHAHTTARERHSLDLKTEALLPALFAGKGDTAPGGDDAMPWQAGLSLQSADRHPCGPRVTGRLGHLTIGNHPPSRDSGDYLSEAVEGCHGPASGAEISTPWASVGLPEHVELPTEVNPALEDGP